MKKVNTSSASVQRFTKIRPITVVPNARSDCSNSVACRAPLYRLWSPSTPGKPISVCTLHITLCHKYNQRKESMMTRQRYGELFDVRVHLLVPRLQCYQRRRLELPFVAGALVCTLDMINTVYCNNACYIGYVVRQVSSAPN